MKHHNRDNYYVVGEGILTFGRDGNAAAIRPSATADVRNPGLGRSASRSTTPGG
jgi:hypothetical protein